MPGRSRHWRGPRKPGEFPTMGFLLGRWMQDHLVIPDGTMLGEPYMLTREMLRHLVHAYRLDPAATEDDGMDAYVHSGSLLIRSQKWGKDPFAAARCCAHAFGPVVFDGWDSNGEPVGLMHPSPWIAIGATTETQTANTMRPVVSMLRNGPLRGLDGLDIADTKIKLPGEGWIEQLTTSATSSMGARYTAFSLTETGLLVGTGRTGGITFAEACKRNVGGMNGLWWATSNAYDPSEQSEAQRVVEGKDPHVHIDFRRPRRRFEIDGTDDTQELLDEIAYLYGDSARAAGGWVSERRILREVLGKGDEGARRRFWLSEVTSGTRVLCSRPKWDSLTVPGDPLRPADRIVLGFDGSRSRDGSALIAIRLRDLKVFNLGVWLPKDHITTRPDGSVDDSKFRKLVDAEFRAALAAYDVVYAVVEPWRWEQTVAQWVGDFPDQVVEFFSNTETRMDDALRYWLALVDGTPAMTNDGDGTLAQHVADTAIAKGKPKPRREDDEGEQEHYLRAVKRAAGLIDGAVASIFAAYGHMLATEKGRLDGAGEVEPWFEYA